MGKKKTDPTYGCIAGMAFFGLFAFFAYATYTGVQTYKPVRAKSKSVQAQATNRPMPHEEPAAETVMIASLPSPNRYRIVYTDFASLSNPHGEGAIVYVPNRTRFNSVERKLAWFVIDGEAFNLNGAAASLTPNLRWPRDADPVVWARTGLDSTASQALRLAFP